MVHNRSDFYYRILPKQVKFREFLSTEYGEAQLDFLLEAMKLETLDADEQDQAATKVCLCWSASVLEWVPRKVARLQTPRPHT